MSMSDGPAVGSLLEVALVSHKNGLSGDSVRQGIREDLHAVERWELVDEQEQPMFVILPLGGGTR